MNRLKIAAWLAAAIALSGCANTISDDTGNGIGPTNPASGNGNPAGGTTAPNSAFRALFSPLAGILPYPTDLYFSGTTDGTLNLPSNPFFPNGAALNALDGFSTTAPISVRFSAGLDPTTLTAANVRVIQVTISNTTKATTGVVRPLVLGTDFSATLATDAGSNGSILRIQPLQPLVPSTGATNNGYLVLVTNGVRDTTGAAAAPDTDYAAIKAALPSCSAITNATLNGVCQLTGAHLQIAGALGVPAANVVLSFSFSTQNTQDTLNAVAAQVAAAAPQPIVARPTGLATNALNPAFSGRANVYAGTLRVR
jgi:hypothetical protein